MTVTLPCGCTIETYSPRPKCPTHDAPRPTTTRPARTWNPDPSTRYAETLAELRVILNLPADSLKALMTKIQAEEKRR